MGAEGDRTSSVRFLLDGEVRTLDGVAPARTVLQLLREDLGRTGCKEGCAEGDCGACTVVLAELYEGGVRYRARNACIQLAATLDGKALVTVESLKGPGGAPHPVQQALADGHATQCGFCTPGFAMSLFALYKTRPGASRREIEEVLAGNLCRCTGYRPIVDAAHAMFAIGAAIPEARQDWLSAPAGSRSAAARASEAELARKLASLGRDRGLAATHARGSFHAPRTLAEFAALRERMPGARILAGGTDLGLEVTKRQDELGDVLHLGEVEELRRIEEGATHLEIGAAVTVSDAAAPLERHYAALGPLLRRFASPPIRNAATLAGNIANASPVGDSMPALIAIGATVVLQKGAATRELALEALYAGYRQTVLQPGEFIARARVPLPRPGAVFRAWKISKRIDQDIATLCGAFLLQLDGGRIAAARVAFGGMAATPRRAAGCEQTLAGRAWTRATRDAAIAALEADYRPIDDLRGRAAYRRRVAGNLLHRLWLETGTGAGAPPPALSALEEVAG